MIIRKLTVHNWLRFRGTHAVKLGPGVYAIVARYEDDPDQSNAAGKTALLEAVEFALNGEHRKRYEDDWITYDEPDGFVELDLGDALVKRSRIRGKSTQLEVAVGGNTMKGDAAQAYIDQVLVGMTKEDFRASSYLRQKQHSRFITGDPKTRQDIIAAWFGLDQIAEAEAYAKSRANAKANLAEQNRSKANAYYVAAQQLTPGASDVWAALEGLLQHAELQVHEAQEQKEWLEAQTVAWLAANSAFALYKTKKSRYDSLVEKGKALRSKLDGIDAQAILDGQAALKTRRDTLVGEVTRAKDEVDRLRRLSVGFDGMCPVTKGACPCRGDVLKHLGMVGDQKDKAEFALSDRRRQLSEIEETFLAGESKVSQLKRDQAELERLRSEVRELGKLEEVADPGPAPQVRSQIAELEHQIASLNQKIGRLVEVAEYAHPYKEALACAQSDETESKRWRKAAQILGKNGAQRAVAQSLLAYIEKRANDILLDAGIKLSISINWSHEGKGFADECDGCGAQYPSKGGKTCAKCGAERPPKIVQKLEVSLSDQSGALDDLAGIAVQLAASEWLHQARGSQWSVVMLDEPYGSLDKTNRTAMSTHVLNMLSTCEQAFVISHTPDTALAMPRRIEVVALHNTSTMKVL